MAGWTDDLRARSLLDCPPAVPLALDVDAAFLPQVSKLDRLAHLDALCRPTVCVPGAIPLPIPFAFWLREPPPPAPRSEDPLFAFMSRQQ